MYLILTCTHTHIRARARARLTYVHSISRSSTRTQDNSQKFMPVFRTLQKSVTQHNDALAKMYVSDW